MIGCCLPPPCIPAPCVPAPWVPYGPWEDAELARLRELKRLREREEEKERLRQWLRHHGMPHGCHPLPGVSRPWVGCHPVPACPPRGIADVIGRLG